VAHASGVLASATFLYRILSRAATTLKKRSFRRDAETSMRDARATQQTHFRAAQGNFTDARLAPGQCRQ
jgi:hypothetical protein